MRECYSQRKSYEISFCPSLSLALSFSSFSVLTIKTLGLSRAIPLLHLSIQTHTRNIALPSAMFVMAFFSWTTKGYTRYINPQRHRKGEGLCGEIQQVFRYIHICASLVSGEREPWFTRPDSPRWALLLNTTLDKSCGTDGCFGWTWRDRTLSFSLLGCCEEYSVLLFFHPYFDQT